MRYKKLTKLLCVGLSLACACASSACGEKEPTLRNAPDYSSSTLQFNFYAYRGPTDGKWTENGMQLSAGVDFRTVERYKEYKDAGMTINFPQSSGVYAGEEFATSKAKMVMDLGLEAGLEKTILTDSRLVTLSQTEGTLIGEGKKFATQAELDETIRGYMAPYRDHPAFYGVVLADEPRWFHFEAYGEVYKSIKRVCPEAFIQCNLNPIIKSTTAVWYPDLTEEEAAGLTTNDEIRVAKYQKYFEMFLDATGADYIMYDQYPLNETYIYEVYVQGLQAAAEVAKKRGVKFYMTTQTMRMVQNLDSKNPTRQRFMGASDAYWLNNMLVGFGVKEIAYFTYFTNPVNSQSSWFYDNGSFINHDGKKTALYDIMQKIMKEEQKLAPTILNYDYVTSNFYKSATCAYSTIHIDQALEGEAFQKVEGLTLDREVALATELYDDEKDLYMYMFQNVTDPINKSAYQEITVDFKDECTHAVLFEKGNRRVVELDAGGKLTLGHNPGHATYVIPFAGIIK